MQASTQKEKKRNAPPPFTTSKLQQAAYNRLRYTAKRTMSLAQRLYEGVELGDEGSVALITYMRSDSVHVSNDALAQVRELIPSRFGAQYLPREAELLQIEEGRAGSSRGGAADGCFADARRRSQISRDDLFKLYQLIWQRFVASQMLPAIFDQTTIDISVRRLHVPRERVRAEVRRLPAVYQMLVQADREEENDDDGESQRASAVERR